MQTKISEKSKVLKDFYNSGIFDFETEKNGIRKRRVVWADSEELLAAIVDLRAIVSDYKVKIMADGG